MAFFDKLKAHLPQSLIKNVNTTSQGTSHSNSDTFAEHKQQLAHGDEQRETATTTTTRSKFGWGIVTGGQSQGRRAWADDDAASPTSLVLRSLQLFFAFITLTIYIALAVVQKSWHVGPSFMTGFALAVCVVAFIASGVFLATPLLSDHRAFTFLGLRGFERLCRQVRVAVILNGFIVLLLLCATIASTVSSRSAGCLQPSDDPHATLTDQDRGAYIDILGTFCRNKRAAAAFFWFQLVAWSTSLALVIYVSWYVARQNPQLARGAGSAFAPPLDHQQAVGSGGGRRDDQDPFAYAAGAGRDYDFERGDENPFVEGDRVFRSRTDYGRGNDNVAPRYDNAPRYDDEFNFTPRYHPHSRENEEYRLPRIGADYRDPFADSHSHSQLDPASHASCQTRDDQDEDEDEDEDARRRRRMLEAADPYDAIRASMDRMPVGAGAGAAGRSPVSAPAQGRRY